MISQLIPIEKQIENNKFILKQLSGDGIRVCIRANIGEEKAETVHVAWIELIDDDTPDAIVYVEAIKARLIKEIEELQALQSTS